MSQQITALFVPYFDRHVDENTFCVPLTLTGGTEVAGYGACGVLDGPLPDVPSLIWFTWSADTRLLSATNSITGGDPNQPWSWAACLESLSYQAADIDL